MTLFGFPIVGVVLLFVGRRRIAFNRGGSIVDTGLDVVADEVDPYYVNPIVFEGLG